MRPAILHNSRNDPGEVRATQRFHAEGWVGFAVEKDFFPFSAALVEATRLSSFLSRLFRDVGFFCFFRFLQISPCLRRVFRFSASFSQASTVFRLFRACGAFSGFFVQGSVRGFSRPRPTHSVRRLRGPCRERVIRIFRGGRGRTHDPTGRPSARRNPPNRTKVFPVVSLSET